MSRDNGRGSFSALAARNFTSARPWPSVQGTACAGQSRLANLDNRHAALFVAWSPMLRDTVSIHRAYDDLSHSQERGDRPGTTVNVRQH